MTAHANRRDSGRVIFKSWNPAVVDIRECGGKPNADGDQREAILEAVDRLKSHGGGRITFPAGRYKTSPITLPEGLQSIEFSGSGPIYSEQTTLGTRIVAIGEQPHVIGIQPSSARIRIKNLNIDCNSQAQTGIAFLHRIGTILDFVDLDTVCFHNVADGGSFVSSVATSPEGSEIPDGMGGENASVQIRNCIFNLNGLVDTAARGTSIYLRNAAGYMWHVHNTHFFGDSGPHGAIKLIAGDLTIENSEFDNNSTVDVYAEASARLTERDVWSGSRCLHARIEQGSLSGLYHEPCRNVFERVTHKSTRAQARSIVDNSNKPTTYSNVEGYGVEINCTTGKDLSVNNVSGLVINGASALASSQVSRGAVNTSAIAQWWNRTLQAYLAVTHTDGDLNEFGFEAYKPGIGYQAIKFVATLISFTGVVDIRKPSYTTSAAPPANTIRLFTTVVDGKAKLMARFPDGAQKVVVFQD